MSDEGERVRPFANGSQFGDWVGSNCERCTKGTAEREPAELCEIAAALGKASWGDGMVTPEIAARMGHGDPDNAGRYVWPCAEVVWTEDWRREHLARLAAKGGVTR